VNAHRDAMDSDFGGTSSVGRKLNRPERLGATIGGRWAVEIWMF